jgi:hypothetical protein
MFLFFKDTLSLSNGATAIPTIATGIAWTTDKTIKFRNPESWANTIKPVNWRVDVFNLSSDPTNTGYENEDLIVWMRTAALPTFRKLYRRVNHSQTGFTDGLPAGNYSLTVDYSKFILD